MELKVNIPTTQFGSRSQSAVSWLVRVYSFSSLASLKLIMTINFNMYVFLDDIHINFERVSVTTL